MQSGFIIRPANNLVVKKVAELGLIAQPFTQKSGNLRGFDDKTIMTVG